MFTLIFKKKMDRGAHLWHLAYQSRPRASYESMLNYCCEKIWKHAERQARWGQMSMEIDWDRYLKDIPKDMREQVKNGVRQSIGESLDWNMKNPPIPLLTSRELLELGYEPQDFNYILEKLRDAIISGNASNESVQQNIMWVNERICGTHMRSNKTN